MPPPYSDALANITDVTLAAYAAKYMPVRPPMPANPPPDPTDSPDNAANYARNLTSALDHVYGGSGLDPIASLDAAILNAAKFAWHNWMEAGKSLPIPSWPTFAIVAIDGSEVGQLGKVGFNNWWTAYLQTFVQGSATYGQGAPPASSGPTQVYFTDPTAPWPIVQLVAAAAPPVASFDGPIGLPVEFNPSLFYSAGAPYDTLALYPAGQPYSGSTGTYVKEIFNDPFVAGGQLVYWILTGPPAAAAVVPPPPSSL